ncbi:MAG: response regulator [Pseudomonadota bacterium]
MAENKKTVLVIDDEKDFVLTLKERLEHDGFNVFEAYDGLEGLEVLRRENISIILLDIMMPRMDGFTFLKTIGEEHEVFPNPPVIVITAYMRLLGKEKRKLIGDIPLFNKPFDYDELLSKIKELLKQD